MHPRIHDVEFVYLALEELAGRESRDLFRLIDRRLLGGDGEVLYEHVVLFDEIALAHIADRQEQGASGQDSSTKRMIE